MNTAGNPYADEDWNPGETRDQMHRSRNREVARMFYPPMLGYLAVTAVCVFLVVWQRRMPIARNSVVGIRTRYTLASDAAWEAGQRAGMPYVIAMAVIGFCHAVALFGVELTDAARVGHIASVLGWVLIIVCAVLAGRAANAAAKTADP